VRSSRLGCAVRRTATWQRVLSLIAEDAVFLLPGQPPMRGREAFAAALRPALGQVHIEGRSEIKEIHVAENYAFCWSQLTVTPFQGGPAQRRAGPTLSVFRKEPMDAGFSFAMRTCSRRYKCQTFQEWLSMVATTRN
jgi:uncharacterized protein (TIGR02246 family)